MVVMGKGGFEVCEVELEVLGTKGRGWGSLLTPEVLPGCMERTW